MRTIAFAVLLTTLISSVYAADDLSNNPWQAQWIGSEKANHLNTWICYRKQITLDKSVKQVVAHIACDSKYWLWINGVPAVYEGQLKRGPNPNDTYYDTVDLSGYFKKGLNTVTVLHWYFGKDGFSHKNSGLPGFIFDASLGDLRLTSDKTWKTTIHPAYGQTGDPHPNYRLPADNVRFDAESDIPGWQSAEFDDSGWAFAIEYGNVPCAPWNHLIERPTPQWRVDDIAPYENNSDLPRLSNGRPIIGKLPRNITISPWLKINASKGQLIGIQTDDYKIGKSCNYRTEYITKEGIQEFESLPYLNGHTVIYTMPAGIEILELGYRQTRYNTDFIGSFQCDDPFFNTLWQKALNTMNLNMRDGIQDPDRERAQWWGDAVIVTGQILYTCDHRGQDLIRKAIDNLVDWQKPDGVLYSPVPAAVHPGKELPCQMLASIGEYGFWYYYFYTGDKKTIEHAYPAVKKYLSLWQIGEDGLVIHRKGDWDWGDWGQDKDRPIMDNAWYYMALKAAVKMAALTGHRDDIPGYEAKMKSIEDNFNKRLWTGTEYRSPNYTDQTDDRGHGLAVVAGLADESQWPRIKEVLQKHFHASPYIEKYILESLFLMNDAEAAMDRMKNRYRGMVESDLTTLWEGWGNGSKPGGGSYNHGWAGGPLTLMFQYIAGISPVAPGFEQFQIRPQMGTLRHIQAAAAGPKGLIRVELEKNTDSFTLKFNCPAASRAHVYIPTFGADYKTLSINGDQSSVAAGRISTPEGVTYESSDRNYLSFTVEPGEWIFSGQFR